MPAFRYGKKKSSERRTVCWREMDSNFRSPGHGELWSSRPTARRRAAKAVPTRKKQARETRRNSSGSTQRQDSPRDALSRRSRELAIWRGVAPWLWAIRTSREFGVASLPAASGYQGIKAIPALVHTSISRSNDRSRRL